MEDLNRWPIAVSDWPFACKYKFRNPRRSVGDVLVQQDLQRNNAESPASVIKLCQESPTVNWRHLMQQYEPVLTSSSFDRSRGAVAASRSIETRQVPKQPMPCRATSEAAA